MPYQDLEIRVQAEGGRVSFRHPKHPEWVLYTSDPQILEHRAFTQRTHLRNQIQAFGQRNAWRNALVVTGACLAVFAVISVVVSWASGQMVRVIAGQISPAWEKDYGDKAFAELKEELKMSNDAEMTARLSLATEPLLRVVKGNFEFHLIENEVPNAFALPGGHVIVNTGLLDLASGPEEIAGVLAHEIAHVTQKHHFRQSISANGPYYITRVFFHRHGVVSLLAAGSQLMLRQNFSRKYEREADEVGWGYLVAANINPQGAIEILKKLKAEEEKLGVEAFTKSGLSSHPPTEERIQRLESKWNKMKRQTGFIEFEKPESR